MASGTASGFDFGDVMQFYSTRLLAIKAGPGRGKFQKGQKEGLGLAHFSITKEGPTAGWLTPDSFLNSVTSMGERVCGYSKEGGEDKTTIADFVHPNDTANISQNQVITPSDVRIPFAIDQENFVSCVKRFDSGFTIGTCLEETCRKPAFVEIDGVKYPVFLCRFHVYYYRSYINGYNNLKYLMMKRGFGIRHYSNDMAKHPGPFEMLISDFFLFYTLVRHRHYAAFMAKAMFNPMLDPDPTTFTACTCAPCQHVYAKRPVAYPKYLARRVLLVLIAIYLLFVTTYSLVLATLPNSSRSKYGSTSASDVTMNKILFQLLLFTVTRATCFSIVNINITSGAGKTRLLAFLLASTDPLICILGRVANALLFNCSKHSKDLWAFFTDFWLMVSIIVSLGASYADVTVSAAQCNYDQCSVPLDQLSLLVVGVVLAMIMMMQYCNPVEILARHAFSEAAGTCSGYTLKEVMEFYTMQVKKRAEGETHLRIVRVKDDASRDCD
ncbi:hypothetical protein HDV05_006190, partial [Chytridiales sp. JEL 0842]